MFSGPSHTALAVHSHQAAVFCRCRRTRDDPSEPNQREEWRVIEVGLLGSVIVKLDGAPVELSGILEKALLARLSSPRDRMLRRVA